MSKQSTVKPRVTVKDLLATINQHHVWNRSCPVCGKDCNKSALVDVVYTFEPCDCVLASYTHLVQTLYHAGCFKKSGES